MPQRPTAQKPSPPAGPPASSASSMPLRRPLGDGLDWLTDAERVVLLTGRPDELLPADQLGFELLAQRSLDAGTRLTPDERRRLVAVWGAVPTRDPDGATP